MRVWFGGPRIMGIRPGVSFGREDFRHLGGAYRASNPARPTTMPRPTDATMIYVIQGDHGRSKIGISMDPNARLAQLRTGSPFPLSIATVYAPDCDTSGALRVEQAAHAMLQAHRCEGEWFDVEPAIAGAAISACAIQQGVKLCQIDAETAAKATAILAARQLTTPPQSRLHKGLRQAAIVIWTLVAILFTIIILAMIKA